MITATRTGVLSGKAKQGGAAFATISGKVSGTNVKIVTTYTGQSYVATFIGKVSNGGKTMGGTWSAGAQSGAWTAARGS